MQQQTVCMASVKVRVHARCNKRHASTAVAKHGSQSCMDMVNTHTAGHCLSTCACAHVKQSHVQAGECADVFNSSADAGNEQGARRLQDEAEREGGLLLEERVEDVQAGAQRRDRLVRRAHSRAQACRAL